MEFGMVQYIFQSIGMSEQGKMSQQQTLKQYIGQLFKKYDTQKKGKLNFQQLCKFFQDLLQSVKMTMPYTYQQLYQVIVMANPAYTGQSTPEEVSSIFKAMLGYGKKASQSPSVIQQPNVIGYQQPGVMGYQQQYQPQQVQMQYANNMGAIGNVNGMYNPYLQMQMQMQMQNQMQGQNGQIWTYPAGYMGVNPFGYRQ